MLKAERELGIKATYNVVGSILPDVRSRIELDGHALGFHSYDHPVSEVPNVRQRLWKKLTNRSSSNGSAAHSVDQLGKCRDVDYRIKGYRPPQSRITSDLADSKLLFHNFEWLASSAYSLNIQAPLMQNRIVRLPILFDDFDMYHLQLDYKAWEAMALSHIERNDFVAFSLHDCYGQYWLPHYKRFLEKISSLGTFKTLDEVAADVTLESAI